MKSKVETETRRSTRVAFVIGGGIIYAPFRFVALTHRLSLFVNTYLPRALPLLDGMRASWLLISGTPPHRGRTRLFAYSTMLAPIKFVAAAVLSVSILVSGSGRLPLTQVWFSISPLP